MILIIIIIIIIITISHFRAVWSMCSEQRTKLKGWSCEQCRNLHEQKERLEYGFIQQWRSPEKWWWSVLNGPTLIKKWCHEFPYCLQKSRFLQHNDLMADYLWLTELGYTASFFLACQAQFISLGFVFGVCQKCVKCFSFTHLKKVRYFHWKKTRKNAEGTSKDLIGQ